MHLLKVRNWFFGNKNALAQGAQFLTMKMHLLKARTQILAIKMHLLKVRTQILAIKMHLLKARNLFFGNKNAPAQGAHFVFWQ